PSPTPAWSRAPVRDRPRRSTRRSRSPFGEATTGPRRPPASGDAGGPGCRPAPPRDEMGAMSKQRGTGLPFGIDFGGSGIKGAPVDLDSGEFAREPRAMH